MVGRPICAKTSRFTFALRAVRQTDSALACPPTPLANRIGRSSETTELSHQLGVFVGDEPRVEATQRPAPAVEGHPPPRVLDQQASWLIAW